MRQQHLLLEPFSPFLRAFSINASYRASPPG
jgi:hypothetical protein